MCRVGAVSSRKPPDLRKKSSDAKMGKKSLIASWIIAVILGFGPCVRFFVVMLVWVSRESLEYAKSSSWRKRVRKIANDMMYTWWCGKEGEMRGILIFDFN